MENFLNSDWFYFAVAIAFVAAIVSMFVLKHIVRNDNSIKVKPIEDDSLIERFEKIKQGYAQEKPKSVYSDSTLDIFNRTAELNMKLSKNSREKEQAAAEIAALKAWRERTKKQ